MHIINVGLIFLFAGSLLAQEGEVNLNIAITARVDFIVTNSWGKKTGDDPRQGGLSYREIPGAAYGVESSDENLGSVSFLYTLVSPQEDGVWKIEVIGRYLGDITIEIFAQPEQSARSFSATINTFIQPNEIQEFALTYNGNPNLPAKLEKIQKVISNYTLQHDISAAVTARLISNKAFTDPLVSEAQQLGRVLAESDMAKAAKHHASIKNVIESVHKNSTATQYISEHAYTVIHEDLEILDAMIHAPVILPNKKRP